MIVYSYHRNFFLQTAIYDGDNISVLSLKTHKGKNYAYLNAENHEFSKQFMFIRISIDRASSRSSSKAVIAHTFSKIPLPFPRQFFPSIFLTHYGFPYSYQTLSGVHFRKRVKISMARNHAFTFLRESHLREITKTLDGSDSWSRDNILEDRLGTYFTRPRMPRVWKGLYCSTPTSTRFYESRVRHE